MSSVVVQQQALPDEMEFATPLDEPVVTKPSLADLGFDYGAEPEAIYAQADDQVEEAGFDMFNDGAYDQNNGGYDAGGYDAGGYDAGPDYALTPLDGGQQELPDAPAALTPIPEPFSGTPTVPERPRPVGVGVVEDLFNPMPEADGTGIGERGVAGAIIDNPYGARTRTWVPLNGATSAAPSRPTAFDVGGLLDAAVGVDAFMNAEAASRRAQAASALADMAHRGQGSVLLNAGAAERLPDALEQAARTRDDDLALMLVGLGVSLLDERDSDPSQCCIAPFAACMPALATIVAAGGANSATKAAGLLSRIAADKGCPDAARTAAVAPLMDALRAGVDAVDDESVVRAARALDVLVRASPRAALECARDGGLTVALSGMQRMSQVAKQRRDAAAAAAQTTGDGKAAAQLSTDSSSAGAAPSALAVLVSDTVYTVAISGRSLTGQGELIQQLVSLCDAEAGSTEIAASVLRLVGALSSAGLISGHVTLNVPGLLIFVLSRHTGPCVFLEPPTERRSSQTGSGTDAAAAAADTGPGDGKLAKKIKKKIRNAKLKRQAKKEQERAEAARRRRGDTLAPPESDALTTARKSAVGSWPALRVAEITDFSRRLQPSASGGPGASPADLLALVAEFGRAVAGLRPSDIGEQSPQLLYALCALSGAVAAAGMIGRDVVAAMRAAYEGSDMRTATTIGATKAVPSFVAGIQADKPGIAAADQATTQGAAAASATGNDPSTVHDGPADRARRIPTAPGIAGTLALLACAADATAGRTGSGAAEARTMAAGADLIRVMVSVGAFRTLADMVRAEAGLVPRIRAAVPAAPAAIASRQGLVSEAGCYLAATIVRADDATTNVRRADAGSMLLHDALGQLETALTRSANSSEPLWFAAAATLFDLICTDGQRRRGLFARSPTPHTTLPRGDIAYADVTVAACRPVYAELLVMGGTTHVADAAAAALAARALSAMKARRCMADVESPDHVALAERAVHFLGDALSRHRNEIAVELAVTQALKKVSKTKPAAAAIRGDVATRQLLAELAAERSFAAPNVAGLARGAGRDDVEVGTNSQRALDRAGVSELPDQP